jgi:hypothetical protein
LLHMHGSQISNAPFHSLCGKWKLTKKALKSWNKNHFGEIQNNIKTILSDLDKIQQSPPSPENSIQVPFKMPFKNN